VKSPDGEGSGETCGGQMGRLDKALAVNNWQGDVGTEWVSVFGTGVVLVSIFRRVVVVCQIFHRILSRAWRVLQSMQKRYSLTRSQYFQIRESLLSEDLQGPRLTSRKARS
jgi:hypothetical protein